MKKLSTLTNVQWVIIEHIRVIIFKSGVGPCNLYTNLCFFFILTLWDLADKIRHSVTQSRFLSQYTVDLPDLEFHGDYELHRKLHVCSILRSQGFTEHFLLQSAFITSRFAKLQVLTKLAWVSIKLNGYQP